MTKYNVTNNNLDTWIGYAKLVFYLAILFLIFTGITLWYFK